MNRKLKALGLALFAAFALSAVAAQAASAAEHHFLSDSGTGVTHLTAKAEGKQLFKATPKATQTVECNEVAVRNATVEGNETTEITAEPVYGNEEFNCVVEPEGLPIRVLSNECHYTFHGETTEDVTGEQSAPVDLTCPGTGILLQVEAAGLTFPCIEIEPNQELEGVKYTEDEANENALTLDAAVHGIKSETMGVCKQSEEPVTHTDGVYTGQVTVTGYEDEAHTEEVDLDLLTTE